MRQVKETLRFIHAADLHLDRPFVGLAQLGKEHVEKMKKSAFHSLDRLVDLAVSEKVHFVVIVGDIFDQALPSIYAEVQFKRALTKLAEHNISVYLSFGNHDYEQTKKMTFDYLENVYVFDQQQVKTYTYTSASGTTVALQGFSYETRHVKEDLSKEYSFKDNVDYCVGMLHGSLGVSDDHETYAPFQLETLKKLGFDYFALGHIHKRQVLSESPPIVYSGNIQGGSKKESGEKGCYIVELNDLQTTFTFHPLQTVRYETKSIAGCSIASLDDFWQVLVTFVEHQAQNSFISIIIENPSDQLRALYHDNDFHDLLVSVNDYCQLNDYTVVILDISLQHKQVNLDQADPFFNTLSKQIIQSKQEDLADDLFDHYRARRFLDSLTSDDFSKAKEEALDYLQYVLIGGRTNESE